MNTKKNRKRVLTICLALLLGWCTFGVQSASAMSCYIDAQPEQAEVGQDVTVTIVFSGDNVGRVRATLEYDKSVLSYQGEEGDSGEVSLYMAGSGDGISYSLPFKAVGEGSSYLTMTPLDAYDMDEMSMSLPEAQSMSVSVKAAQAAPAEPEKKDEGQSDSEKPEVKDDTQKDTAADKDKSQDKDQQQDQQPEQKEEKEQQAEEQKPKDEKSPDQKEVEALIRKALERSEEHEADKRNRMRKMPLSPNERDW